MTKKMVAGLIFSILFSPHVLAQLTPEAADARDKGVLLFKQSAWDSAQPSLKIAAEAGDPKAQYYLGEAIRLNNMYMTSDARKWYESAAEQGDLYAMLRLSSSDDLCKILGSCEGNSNAQWRSRAKTIARERAGNGDTEAMIVLYRIGEGLSWLKKAAEDSDSRAQHSLAIVYKNGGGWFLLPGSREKAVKHWAKASAESGYAPGMEFYANFLYEHHGTKEEVAYWLKRTAEAGHLAMLGSYALYVAHMPDILGYPLNLIEAYGITYLITKLTGGGVARRNAERNLPEIAEKMTAEEVQQGIAYAAEWKKTHPPLSYYPPVFGY